MSRTSTTSLLSPLREHFAFVAMQPPNVGMSFQKPTRGIDVRGRIIKSTWCHHAGFETRKGRREQGFQRIPLDTAVRLQGYRYREAGAPPFAVAGGSRRNNGISFARKTRGRRNSLLCGFTKPRNSERGCACGRCRIRNGRSESFSVLLPHEPRHTRANT